MKAIKHETITQPNGVTIEEYTLDTGYRFQDGRDENGDQFSALWTKKNKPVKPGSVTYQRAEKAVDKFANATRSKL
jgi:hypothetical protein